MAAPREAMAATTPLGCSAVEEAGKRGQARSGPGRGGEWARGRPRANNGPFAAGWPWRKGEWARPGRNGSAAPPPLEEGDSAEATRIGIPVVGRGREGREGARGLEQRERGHNTQRWERGERGKGGQGEASTEREAEVAASSLQSAIGGFPSPWSCGLPRHQREALGRPS